MVTEFPVLCSGRTASHSCMAISYIYRTRCHAEVTEGVQLGTAKTSGARGAAR
jgi:hypothetical protein